MTSSFERGAGLPVALRGGRGRGRQRAAIREAEAIRQAGDWRGRTTVPCVPLVGALCRARRGPVIRPGRLPQPLWRTWYIWYGGTPPERRRRLSCHIDIFSAHIRSLFRVPELPSPMPAFGRHGGGTATLCPGVTAFHCLRPVVCSDIFAGDDGFKPGSAAASACSSAPSGRP